MTDRSLCRDCRKREPEDGRARCRECIDHVSALRAPRDRVPVRTAEARLAQPDDTDGWCLECQAHGFHRDDCPEAARIRAKEKQQCA